ncbi:MAG: restriction endonuclease [Clostridiales bacterium]|nr:restriction endonuclease [Clostridiales bacterium]
MTGRAKNTAIFGECKWTNEKVDSPVLHALIRRSRLFSYEKKYYYIFAKNGFTSDCRKSAEELGNVILVSYEEIMNTID